MRKSADKKSKRKEKLRQQKARLQQRKSRDGPMVTRQNLNDSMIAAVQLHQKGKIVGASDIYRQILKIAPEHPDALSSLAMIELSKGYTKKAIRLIRQAIDLVDDNAGYYMNLGAALHAAGLPEDAIVAYEAAIDLSPTYPDPYYNLGDLHLQAARPKDAIAVFDRCIGAMGRDFHALAYKAHAFDDANQSADARYLLDYDQYLKTYRFETPEGFASMEAFNAALAEHIRHHPTLQSNVMSTEHGEHTGELLRSPVGPMEAMELQIHAAIRWYKGSLPNDPAHPAVAHMPDHYKLTSWGVVMNDRGHERAHIHPKGWLSGVFYVQLPDVINDPAKHPEGWLEFGRPTADLHVQSPLHLRHHQPDYGHIVLFPSYFYHGTIPFRSKQRRICVAFDVEPI